MADLAVANDVTFTVYVDDMVFSGSNASRKLARAVQIDLARTGLKGHKICHFNPGQVRVITGVALSEKGTSIPWKRQMRTRIYEAALHAVTDPDEIAVLGRALMGQFREGERLQPGFKDRAKPIADKLEAFEIARFRDLTDVTRTRRKPRRKSRNVKRDISAEVSALRSRMAAGADKAAPEVLIHGTG